jgi:hypothetical protein
MQQFIQKNRLALAGVVAGAIFGFFYWKWVGCSSGTCMISSKPLNSSVYFAVMGGLVFSMFKKESKETADK